MIPVRDHQHEYLGRHQRDERHRQVQIGPEDDQPHGCTKRERRHPPPVRADADVADPPHDLGQVAGLAEHARRGRPDGALVQPVHAVEDLPRHGGGGGGRACHRQLAQLPPAPPPRAGPRRNQECGSREADPVHLRRQARGGEQRGEREPVVAVAGQPEPQAGGRRGDEEGEHEVPLGEHSDGDEAWEERNEEEAADKGRRAAPRPEEHPRRRHEGGEHHDGAAVQDAQVRVVSEHVQVEGLEGGDAQRVLRVHIPVGRSGQIAHVERADQGAAMPGEHAGLERPVQERVDVGHGLQARPHCKQHNRYGKDGRGGEPGPRRLHHRWWLAPAAAIECPSPAERHRREGADDDRGGRHAQIHERRHARGEAGMAGEKGRPRARPARQASPCPEGEQEAGAEHRQDGLGRREAGRVADHRSTSQSSSNRNARRGESPASAGVAPRTIVHR
ncbi:MAG TPA: hypothetical protein VLB81_06620 [Gaiellales bacterium]|nr:hypothetical protein [Gaiellales bacterium]